jgi:hypothetical protein
MNKKILHISFLILIFLYIVTTYETGIYYGVEIGGVVLIFIVYFVLSTWFSSPHYDGTMNVISVDGKKVISLELYKEPEELIVMKDVSFKVVIDPKE